MGSTTVTIELEVEVEFDYSPGTPDVMYLPNGDPGYPGEAPEMAITRLYKRSKSEGIIDLMDCLTDDDLTAIENGIIEDFDTVFLEGVERDEH